METPASWNFTLVFKLLMTPKVGKKTCSAAGESLNRTWLIRDRAVTGMFAIQC